MLGLASEEAGDPLVHPAEKPAWPSINFKNDSAVDRVARLVWSKGVPRTALKENAVCGAGHRVGA